MSQYDRDMIDRILALLVVIAAAVIPEATFEFLQSRVAQFIAAFFVVAIMIVYDVYTGLLLGLALVVIYFRLNTQDILSWGSLWGGEKRNGGPMMNLVQDYITPEHLHNAQTNVVDMNDYKVEMKGIKGVYGEPVYGAQGLDDAMPGFTKETSLQGDVFTRG